MELPKIISVDDHVVEPAHVWQTWLPEKHREKGPRVERKKWGAFKLKKGAKYDMSEDPDGEWGDAWIYEDHLIYVQKKFVAIPKDATGPDDDWSTFDKTRMTMTATTYDDMRDGCYDAKARKEDFERNWVDGSLPFPTFPRFCGQTFYEADDKELALACVQAYNDWMVEEWCDPSIGLNIPLCIIPLWDPELAAQEIRRNAARGVRAVCFSELPTKLDLPSIHTGHWDPMFTVCNETATTVCMHVGSSSTDPFSSRDAPPGVGSMVGFNNSMASLGDYLFGGIMHRFPKLKIAYSEGQIGWLPYALERADTVWEEHNAWQNSKRLCPEPPSTYYYDRVFGCFTWDRHGVRSLDEVGENNICFETDYPHTDTTWPNTKAYCEKMLEGVPEEQAYKIVRGNAIKMLDLDRGLSDVTTIGPALDGSPSLFSVAFELETVGFTVAEHVVSGTAERYAHVGRRDPDGRWEVEPTGSAPFTTRVVVARPLDPALHSGTVVVEWLNVTGGLDIPALWMPTHRHLVRSGATWVGVTVQQVGIHGGGGVLEGLALQDVAPERYGVLSHPGDPFAFDLFSQVGRALRESLPALHGVPVDRMIAVGASQSAMYLTTYINAIDRTAAVFDGFLLQGRAGAAVPIDGWVAGSVRFRDDDDGAARRSRLSGTDHIRTDARVPVMIVQSETDVFGSLAYLPARQDDGDRLRLWEVAGAAHCDSYFLLAAAHDSGLVPVEDLAALVGRGDGSGFATSLPINSGPQMHYVLQRALEALERWLRDGTPPSSADRIAVDAAGRLCPDELGVAVGGVRTPWVDAPVAVLSGLGQQGVLTELFGTTTPLPPGALAELYPGGRAHHTARFRDATRRSIDEGFLSAADGGEIEALGALAWPEP